MDETHMLTIEAAARYLGLSVNSVRQLVRNEEVQHARYFGKLMFRREDLDAWIDTHTFEAA